MFSLIVLAADTLNKTGDAGDGLAAKIASFFDFIIGRVPSWIAGIIVFILAFAAAKIAKTAVESRISDKIDEEHQEVLILSGRVSYFGTLIFGITIALKIAGIDLTTILAAVAFGIGFALQDLIMNFLSGVLLLVNRQFTIGDFIKVGSTLGRVMEIQTRATILKAVDGTKVIVPNATIFRSQVVSMTTNPTRRISIPIYISYDVDIKYAIKIAMHVLKKHPKIIQKPAPSIIVKDYGDSEIDLEARFWVGSRDGWIKIKSAVMHEMIESLAKAGIDAPFNTVHVENEGDTKEYLDEYAKIRKEKMIEMKLSKAIEEDAKETAAAQAQAAASMAPLAAATPVVDASAPVAPTAAVTTPAATPTQTTVTTTEAALLPTPTSVDPRGDHEDMVEIDGQG